MRGLERSVEELRLFDLVCAVQDVASDDREVVAALQHLLNAPAATDTRRRRPPRERPRRHALAHLFALALLLGASASRADVFDRTACPATPAEPVTGAAPTEEIPAPTEATQVSASEESTGYTLLPTRPLYDPLIADPRWPRFSAEWQWYRGDPELSNVGSVAFGGLLPLVQGPLPGEGRWELGFQAGVFSIFDMSSDSKDLINTDFWVGIPITARWGWFSTLMRVYHQSSHLGDEFLLRGGVDRVNLSYEAVDVLPSFDLWDWGRIYFGGGWLFDVDPSSLKRWYAQLGGTLKSPVAFWGWLRPIAALDLKKTAEQDWGTDYSVKFGFQFENEKVFKGRQLLLLGGYYKGNSPNGQFFGRRIEFWSAGLQFYF